MESRFTVAAAGLYEAAKFVTGADHPDAPLVELQVDASGVTLTGRGSTVTLTAPVSTSDVFVTEPFAFVARATAFEAFAYVPDADVEFSLVDASGPRVDGALMPQVRVRFETVRGVHGGIAGRCGSRELRKVAYPPA